MFSIVYDFLLLLAGICVLPSYWWRSKLGSLSQRLFFRYPVIDPDRRPIIWVHAVSLGETRAIVPLVKDLLSRWKDEKECEPYLIISSVTQTGHEEAKRSLPEANAHVYLPLDTSWNVKRCLRGIRPVLVILAEGDLWCNFLTYCKRQGARITVVSAKVSERTTRRLSRFPFLADRIYGAVDLYCVQNRLYDGRLASLGVPADKRRVVGNVKFDADYPQLSEREMAAFRARLALDPSDYLLTIGSTHDPEERKLLERLKPIWHVFPRFKILLVPRHPERFDTVARLVREMGFRLGRYSEGRLRGDEQVLLIDTMGQLCSCYQLSLVALVAGSFNDRIGGHNLLEPLAYNVPVLFGPHTFTQVEMRELVLQAGAGKEVALDQVSAMVENLLADRSQRKLLAITGKELTSSLKGSRARTVNLLLPLMDSSIDIAHRSTNKSEPVGM